MEEIIDAGQTTPYELLKSRFLFGQKNRQLSDLIDIVLLNKPNYNIKDIEKMFFELKNCGCKYSVAANSVVSSIISNNISYDNLRYSLKISGSNVIDYNKVLVDMFSCLYGLSRVSFAKYEVELFDSIKDICEKYGSTVELTDKHKKILAGNDESTGKIKVKSLVPEVTTDISNYEEVARKYFGVEKKNITADELKVMFKNIGIEFNSRDYEPSKKVSGLFTDNFNFWMNKYFEMKNLDLEFNAVEVSTKDYDYEELIGQLNLLRLQGINTSVSTSSDKEIWVYGDGKLSWSNLYDKFKGHAMTFKGIKENGDIIVSCWGQNMYIPKEYWRELEYLNISIYPKQKRKLDEEKAAIK